MPKVEELKKDNSPLELGDTIDDMCSEDYKKRFIAEYTQNCIRYNKLKKFIGKIKYSKYADQPEPKHDCPLDLLEKQLITMQLYIAILEVRAEEYEHIKLPKVREE